MTAQQPTSKAMTLKSVNEKLTALLTANADAFPQGFNQTRFLQNCLTVLNDTDDIEKMNPVSIARTMIKGAFLNLDFFNRECYAIPYGTTLNFQTDYKGEVKVAKQFSISPIKDIYAKLVREDEELNISIVNGKQQLEFAPKPFSTAPVVGAFAVVVFQDDSIMYETMSTAEIEKIRDSFSKCPKSKAWMLTPGEMYKKTVLRRLCKLISLNFSSVIQQRAYQEGSGVDLTDKKEDKTVPDPFASDPKIIDAEFSANETPLTEWEKEDLQKKGDQ